MYPALKTLLTIVNIVWDLKNVRSSQNSTYNCEHCSGSQECTQLSKQCLQLWTLFGIPRMYAALKTMLTVVYVLSIFWPYSWRLRNIAHNFGHAVGCVTAESSYPAQYGTHITNIYNNCTHTYIQIYLKISLYTHCTPTCCGQPIVWCTWMYLQLCLGLILLRFHYIVFHVTFYVIALRIATQ
jgi:hypothetical protein